MKCLMRVRSYKGMKSQNQNRFLSQDGQIVVEYVLLLAMAVTIAMIIVSALIDRGDVTDPESSGALIQQWHLLQQTIGEDIQN